MLKKDKLDTLQKQHLNAISGLSKVIKLASKDKFEFDQINCIEILDCAGNAAAFTKSPRAEKALFVVKVTLQFDLIFPGPRQYLKRVLKDEHIKKTVKNFFEGIGTLGKEFRFCLRKLNKKEQVQDREKEMLEFASLAEKENTVFSKYICDLSEKPIRFPVVFIQFPEILLEMDVAFNHLAVYETFKGEPVNLSDLRVCRIALREIEKEVSRLKEEV